jgi:RNA recognition motif-containing protein
MGNKLYIGNLSSTTTEEDLKDNFNSMGTCTSVKIIIDRDTGRSKGFAFVEMSTDQEAQDAILKCKGVELDGKKLIVNEARPKENSNKSSGYGFNSRNRY